MERSPIIGVIEVPETGFMGEGEGGGGLQRRILLLLTFSMQTLGWVGGRLTKGGRGLNAKISI